MQGLWDPELVKCKMHQRNCAVVRYLSELPIKDKRRVFALLRSIPAREANHVFPTFQGVTVGEFCLTQVLVTDSKKKLREFLAQADE